MDRRKNKSILLKFGLNTLVLGLTAYVIDGVYINGLTSLIWASIVLGILNIIVKPIFILFTLPINILSLGLFTFFINSMMLMLTSSFVRGFVVVDFRTGVLAAIVLSLLSFLLNYAIDSEEL
ncbi:MAG: phage holin family protein [Fusobacteriota bacterium]